MGIWIASAALADGERTEFSAIANSFQGRRSVGGRVTVTDRRLLFQPNRLDGLTGGRSIDVPREGISRVWAESGGARSTLKRGLAAAVRDQVGIEFPGGRAFVTLPNPARLIAALAAT